jgi:hypothetical protein
MIFLRGLQKKPAAASGAASARASSSGRRPPDAAASAAASAAVSSSALISVEHPLYMLASQSNETVSVTVRVREWVVSTLAALCPSRNAAVVEAGVLCASGGFVSHYYRCFNSVVGIIHRQRKDPRLLVVPDWALAYVTRVHDQSDASFKLLEQVVRTKAEMEQDARGSWKCRATGCGGQNCTFVIVQTRSADEGSTVYTKCMACGNLSYVG